MERSDVGEDDVSGDPKQEHSVERVISENDIPEAILELDHVFEALAHPRRRYLLYTLQEGTEWTLTELATKLAARENDLAEESVGRDEHSRVYTSLYHAHVPKLVDSDVLTFETGAEIIRPGPNAEQVLAVLEGAGASFDSRQEAHARRENDE